MDAHFVSLRPMAGLAVLVVAGCTGSAGLASAPGPTSTPVPTAAATAARTPTPSLPSNPPAGLTGPLGVGRQIHTATLLADGRVLVVGGYDVGDHPLASAVLYDPGTDVFTPTGSLAMARGLHTATRLSDGRILIAGGGPASWVSGAAYLASAELFDPKTGTFTPTGSMTTAREDHTATELLDGRVLIAGGNDTGDHAVASAELYDPKTGTFSPTGSMVTARGFHTATRLADGRVLIAGGDSGSWDYGGRIFASAELYDPKTGTFKATGPMAGWRAWHTATLLADGRVLVAGGEKSRTDLASAELYDPKAGTFSPTGAMTVGRVFYSATLLSDGRVLVEGGGSDYAALSFLASAEIYDPKTGSFTATSPMADGRNFQAATLLRDGRVLVCGGYGPTAPLASAEIYDPTTGTFSPAG